MKSPALLNVKPPFYKGLSLSEVGLLTTFNTLIMTGVGAGLMALTGIGMLWVLSVFLGLVSVFAMPKVMINAITRAKRAHCQSYFEMKFDRFKHAKRYQTQSRKMATKRIEDHD